MRSGFFYIFESLVFWVVVFLFGFLLVHIFFSSSTKQLKDCGSYEAVSFNAGRIPARCEKELRLFHELRK